ncbi:hypothetical protein G9P44_006094 [Scheffersomyces stipitis]|nr:hypothetical protein G9P44_006094 [Scheffersomyces stipitis]
MEYENSYLEEEELLEQQQHHQPSQTVVDEAELLAAQSAAEAAAAQQAQQPGGAFSNVGQGLTGKHRDMMMQYWQETINSIEHDDHDFKNHQLPLARIKKVMKTDEDVRMISAEAPILFAKGCDVFITELTMRAWIHAEENKRRTLQKSDIAAALTKSDMFDFLIDVVPREEEKPKKSYTQSRSNSYITHPQGPSTGMGIPDPRQNAIVEQEPKEVVQSSLKQEDADMLQQRLLEEQLVQQRLQQSKSSQPQQNLQETSDHSGENTPQEPEANGARQDRNFQNFGQFNQEYQGNY